MGDGLEQTVAFWLAAGAATFAVGMSKGGLPMMAMLGVPILSVFIPPAAAAGLLLPMYILADVYAIWLFRHEFSVRNVSILVPASALGIVAGASSPRSCSRGRCSFSVRFSLFF